MKKKINAAVATGSEAGDAAASWPYPDLKPLPVAVKPGHRYLAHTTFDGVEFEAPNTQTWWSRSVTVEVIATGRDWIDERTWTFDGWTREYSTEPVYHPTWPPGEGWNFEKRLKPSSPYWRPSSSWRR